MPENIELKIGAKVELVAGDGSIGEVIKTSRGMTSGRYIVQVKWSKRTEALWYEGYELKPYTKPEFSIGQQVYFISIGGEGCVAIVKVINYDKNGKVLNYHVQSRADDLSYLAHIGELTAIEPKNIRPVQEYHIGEFVYLTRWVSGVKDVCMVHSYDAKDQRPYILKDYEGKYIQCSSKDISKLDFKLSCLQKRTI